MWGLIIARVWTRLVIEKPFGKDLKTAQELNETIHQHFIESQVYRIDHYLGKETVQNLLAFRFANPIFESIWNRDRVQNVQITVAEQLGVGTRAGYYDKAGALRDMVQNHLTQLMTLTAMEAPANFDADAIRDEKVKVLRSIKPISASDVIFGQYGPLYNNGHSEPGYLQESGVAQNSKTENLCRATPGSRQLALAGCSILPSYGQTDAAAGYSDCGYLQETPHLAIQKVRRLPCQLEPPDIDVAARRRL